MKKDIIILRILIAIGVLKILTVVALLGIYNPKVQYLIHPTTPTQKTDSFTETGAFMPTDPNLSAPKIVSIEKHFPFTIHIHGTGARSSNIVLYIIQTTPSKQSDTKSGISVYTTPVKEDGTWDIEENRSAFELTEGSYAGTVLAYYPLLGKKSPSSDQFDFTLKEDTVHHVIAWGDTFATYFVIAAAVGGLGEYLTAEYVHRRKKKLLS